MTENEAIKWLREMQNPIMSEAELYCAETCYGSGKMVYPEPEDYVFETAIQALEEIQQYRAIGTIEEFKALKEKATPKKLEIEKFWGYDDLMCPNCKSYKIRNPKYCCDCGQKLDWEGGADD